MEKPLDPVAKLYRLVFEKVLTEILGNIASLDIHAFDHSMDFRALIANLVSTLRETSTQLSEVFTCLGCHFVKQLYNDFVVWVGAALRLLGGVVLHIDVTLTRCVVDAIFVSFCRHV